MKKYIKILPFTAALMAVGLFLPDIIINSIPTVELTAASETEIENDIYASGTVETVTDGNIYARLPLVPETVTVEVGDYVERGEVIAVIDENATARAIISAAASAELIPQEYVEAIGKININSSMLSAAVPKSLTAPISGTVTSLSLAPGAIASAQTAVCTVERADDLRIKLAVSEEAAERVETGDTVAFKAVATGDIMYFGEVERIFPTATTVLNGTSLQTVVELYVTPIGDISELKSGYTVSGVIKKNDGRTALTVPYTAIGQDKQNIEYVYLYKNSAAVRQNVETGAELPNGAEIISGITAEDIIIATPEKIKRDGQRVRGVSQWN